MPCSIGTIELTQGDTFAVAVTRTNADGTPVNIAATTITAKLFKNGLDLSLTVVKTNAALGQFQIRAEIAATALYPLGTLYLSGKYTDGNVVETFPQNGTIEVNVSKVW